MLIRKGRIYIGLLQKAYCESHYFFQCLHSIARTLTPKIFFFKYCALDNLSHLVLKRLNRDGPGAKVRSNLRSKSLPKIANFSKNQNIHVPSFITFIPNPVCTLAFHLSKSSEKNLAYWGLLGFRHKLSIPLLGRAKWNFEHKSC